MKKIKEILGKRTEEVVNENSEDLTYEIGIQQFFRPDVKIQGYSQEDRVLFLDKAMGKLYPKVVQMIFDQLKKDLSFNELELALRERPNVR